MKLSLSVSVPLRRGEDVVVVDYVHVCHKEGKSDDQLSRLQKETAAAVKGLMNDG